MDLRTVAQDEAPLRGREEPGGGTLTARHAGKGNPRGARTATERRRLQHGVGAQLSALPGALLLSALLPHPPFSSFFNYILKELNGPHFMCEGICKHSLYTIVSSTELQSFP